MLGLQTKTMAVKETSYTNDTTQEMSTIASSFHKLHDNWIYWAHLPHDTDWTLKSYKKILTFNIDDISQCNIFIISVPTPINKDKKVAANAKTNERAIIII